MAINLHNVVNHNAFSLIGDLVNYNEDKFIFIIKNPIGSSVSLPILMTSDAAYYCTLTKGHTYYNKEILVCFDLNKKGNVVLRCLAIKPDISL